MKIPSICEGERKLVTYLNELNLPPNIRQLVFSIFSTILNAIESDSSSDSSSESDSSSDSSSESKSSSDSSSQSTDKTDDDPIELPPFEACFEKLAAILNYFTNFEEERRQFIGVFLKWRPKRIASIKKLRNIAEEINDVRRNTTIAQVASGAVAVAGGAAIIGAVLFPPAAVLVLPGWLGGAAAGAAVSAFIPSVLLPAAAVSAPVVIGGAVAATSGAVGQVAAVVIESIVLDDKTKLAKGVLEEDKEHFKLMERWFKHTQELEASLNHFFGSSFRDFLFESLEAYESGCLSFRETVKRIINNEKFDCDLPHYITAAALALLMAVVTCHGLVLVYQVIKVIMAEAGKKLLGVLAGIGVAFDLANTVLGVIDLSKGCPSEKEKKVLDIVQEFQDELDVIEEAYNQVHRQQRLNFLFPS